MSTKSSAAARAVGHQVRVAIVEQGQSQTSVALATGMAIDAMSRRISGRVSFRADELIQIAEHLGIDPARFFRPVPRAREPEDDTLEAAHPARARGAA